jgi:hypothetical protein
MYNLDRYEFSATDSLYEKLDAKLGNYLVRSEEKAEARHAAYMQKMREKYAKAKAKADEAEAYYASRSQERVARVSNFMHNYDSSSRVVDI